MSKMIIQESGTQVLLEKWSNNIKSVNEAYNGNLTQDRQVTLATCLESVDRAIKRAQGQLNEATQLRDLGQFKKHAFELVTAVSPNLIANDIVSVQPLKSRTGEVRFMKYVYGSNKGGVTAGTTFASAMNGSDVTKNNFNYSSETVDTEIVGAAGATEYKANLMWYPIKPGTLQIGTTIKDNGAGGLTGTGVAAGSTIDYNTGALDLKLSVAAAEDILATYEYSLTNAPSKAAEVDVVMDIIPMMARTRKLKALYSFDASYDLQQDYGYDIGTDIVANTAAEIKHEIDGEIMDDLFNLAGLQATQWSAVVPSGISMKDHYASFYNKIVECSNMILDATKRVQGTFLIVGTQVANVVESLDQFRSVAAPGTVGPHLAGYLNGTIPVYKNPYYGPTQYVVGYKGQGLFEAGYVYAPYMPIIATSLIMDDSFVGRRGFATSYSKKLTNPNMYVKGSIVFA